jgi:hypothetical protein
MKLVSPFQRGTNFMPVLGGVTVVPDALANTWRALKPFFS